MKSIKFNTIFITFFVALFSLNTFIVNGQINLSNCDYELISSNYAVKSLSELKVTVIFSSNNIGITGTATIQDYQNPEIVWDSVTFSTFAINSFGNQYLRLVFTGTSGSIITFPDDYELFGKIVISHQGIQEQNCEFTYTCQKSEEEVEFIDNTIAKISDNIIDSDTKQGDNKNTYSSNRHLNNANAGTVLGNKHFTMKDHLINVYPNPAPEYIFIQSGILKENLTATIYNSQGVAVSETNISKPVVRVETMNLADGLYFLLVSDGAEHINLTKLYIE